MDRTQKFLVPGMECLLCSLHWSEGSKGEEIKKYGREGVSVWDCPNFGPLATRPVSRNPGDLSECPDLGGNGVSPLVTGSL